ncbi:MAG: MATE family efflux transporter [Beduini sp.]|uniref:MATE family efflux transporter n=1 Tax=Beduini sp. TaxID=1922300 RepID=UPI0039A19942
MKGKSNHQENENDDFMAAFIGSILLGIVAWLIFILFERQLLTVFGAEENLLPLAQHYLIPIKFIFPCFLLNQMLAAFFTQ